MSSWLLCEPELGVDGHGRKGETHLIEAGDLEGLLAASLHGDNAGRELVVVRGDVPEVLLDGDVVRLHDVHGGEGARSEGHVGWVGEVWPVVGRCEGVVVRQSGTQPGRSGLCLARNRMP